MRGAVQHIAFISPRFAEGSTVGGAETLLKNLSKRLLQKGMKVTFLATCAENHFTWENSLPAGKKTIEGIEVIRFPVDRKEDSGAFSDIQSEIAIGVEVSEADELRWIANSVNSEALYAHLRQEGAAYDCIITGPYLFGITWFAAQILPEKTLLLPCLHDEPYAHLRIMKQLFESVKGIIYNAQPEAELAQKLYGIAPEKGRVVGMALDSFEADAQAFKDKFNIDRPYVLYCGRREVGKGTPLLTRYIQTFRERTGRDIMLICTGSGTIDAPGELRPHLLDLGFVSEADKRNAMAGAIAFIHPSTFESFGIVLLESFLAGTPGLVHAACNVLKWQCQQAKAGLWFRHYPDFEEELLLLLDHAELREALGASGRTFVQSFYNQEAVDARLLHTMEELLV